MRHQTVPAQAPAVPHSRIVAVIGMLMSLSAFSIDITLPALPTMARDFGAPMAKVQWTISLYFLMLGLGQLIWGPLSDRFGRRPVLGIGLILFSLCSLAAAIAPTIDTLIIVRCLQGLAAASAVAITRAMLRDLFSGDDLARAMGLAMAIFAVGPMLAPFLGAGLLLALDWHAVFLGLAVIGMIGLLLVLALPETLADPDPAALKPAHLAGGMRAILDDRQSRWFLALSPFAMAPMVFMLAMLPAVYERQFGIEGLAFSVLFACHGVGIIIGQIVNRRLIRRFGTLDTMLAGAAVLVSVGAAITLLSFIGWIGPAILTGLFVLFGTSFLVVVSNATSLYLTPHGRIAGLATAVFTATAQFGSGILVSIMVLAAGNTTLGLGLSILALCMITLAGGWAYRRGLATARDH